MPQCLSGAIANFSSITEDQTTTSDTVSTLLNSGLTDADVNGGNPDNLGIAITSFDASNGTFIILPVERFTAFPTISSGDALLLDSANEIRFVPDQANADAASITYRGWDQDDGLSAGSTTTIASTGGITSFSSGEQTSTIAVTAVNDAPTFTSASGVSDFSSITEDDVSNNGETVSPCLMVSLLMLTQVQQQGLHPQH